MQAYRFTLNIDGKELELAWELYEDNTEAIQRAQILLSGVVDTGRAKSASVAVFADIELLGFWDWSAEWQETTWTTPNQ